MDTGQDVARKEDPMARPQADPANPMLALPTQRDKRPVQSSRGYRPNRQVKVTIVAILDVPGFYGDDQGRDPASEVESRLVWYVADDDPGGAKTLTESISVEYADGQAPQ